MSLMQNTHGRPLLRTPSIGEVALADHMFNNLDVKDAPIKSSCVIVNALTVRYKSTVLYPQHVDDIKDDTIVFIALTQSKNISNVNC